MLLDVFAIRTGFRVLPVTWRAPNVGKSTLDRETFHFAHDVVDDVQSIHVMRVIDIGQFPTANGTFEFIGIP